MDGECRRHAGLGVKRGDIVVVAIQGDYGKPRPALLIQSDLFGDHISFTLLPLTSDVREAARFRISVEPDSANGLRLSSRIMIDKAMTIPREKIGAVIGRLDEKTMLAVNQALTVFLGII